MKTSKPLLSNKIEDINSKLNEEELNNFTADCLKKYCKENSIPTATTKANIIINLIEHFSSNNNSSSNKQPLNDLSNIQQQPQIKMKSILKKNTDKENKENIKEIIDKVENLTISKNNENSSNKKTTTMTTRRKTLEQQEEKEKEKEKEDQSNKKKVTFNSVNQIGFIEKKEKNSFKYYINTNQNSPMKNESPLKIVNNQSYSIFDFLGKEEEEFDTENMKTWELKEALEINGLSTEGDKQQLKERLESFIIETLNKSNDHGSNESNELNESIEEDWIRWTPLKAKNSKITSTSSDNDKKKSSKTTKKIIKSKSKPTKKSRKDEDNEDDVDDESYDDDDEDEDNSIMSSQQLFNAFIDVSVTNNKKKK